MGLFHLAEKEIWEYDLPKMEIGQIVRSFCNAPPPHLEGKDGVFQRGHTLSQGGGYSEGWLLGGSWQPL